MKRNKFYSFLLFFLGTGLLLSLAGCINQDKLAVYQKSLPIPNYKWDYSFTPSFSFQIEDTSARYDLYITIRHTNQYAYSNLWVRVHSAFEGERPTKKRVELPLAAPSGEWLGSGMDDIYEHRIPIQQNVRFDKAGTYHFSLEQNMRVNPLPQVMAIGLRVEKITP